MPELIVLDGFPNPENVQLRFRVMAADGRDPITVCVAVAACCHNSVVHVTRHCKANEAWALPQLALKTLLHLQTEIERCVDPLSGLPRQVCELRLMEEISDDTDVPVAYEDPEVAAPQQGVVTDPHPRFNQVMPHVFEAEGNEGMCRCGLSEADTLHGPGRVPVHEVNELHLFEPMPGGSACVICGDYEGGPLHVLEPGPDTALIGVEAVRMKVHLFRPNRPFSTSCGECGLGEQHVVHTGIARTL